MEVDNSQIEVAVQAFLSGDESMKQDVRDGVDFHCKRLAFKNNIAYADAVRYCKIEKHKGWVEQRRKAKAVSFQKAYGASAKAIAESTGMPIKEVVDFMEAEDKLYPCVPKQNEKWIKEVESNAYYLNKPCAGGLQEGGHIDLPNGQRFTFKTWPAPDFIAKKTGKACNFKPTQIKNYPIQGFAAFIMKVQLALLNRAIKNKELTGVLLINTVHDSVLFDCFSLSAAEDNMKEIEQIMTTDTIHYIGEEFGVDIDIPLRVDFSIGKDWYNMKEVQI